MKLNQRGLLIVVSGPSGVGKGTVRKALFDIKNHNLVYSVSMTTRKPREGEIDGQDYYFVSKEEFLDGIKNDKFLEWAEFVGNYYGTPLDKIEAQLDQGKEVVLEIEVEGALQVRERMKDAVFIFIVPPGKQALYDRLKKRGTESEEIIKQRVEKADKEFLLAYKYDYIVVNDDVNNAADRIMAIIRAEHAKTERTIHNYIKMLEE
ncbi:Guanylate kinase [Alteracholeplasma palmae J233]|uniref:Guanylate kinase n=1 Tax=Alteracholeplasma palmae (strain ATCC 49389 / J233) TaxID=1318466 RepID=U4KL21_ALTPJ|nr:guanylate kinase [Alteracholeplasma palmae]CCV64564.1 Guanylate kinase [Alteracholeplasma palmae J233]